MAQNQGKEAASTTPMPFPPEIYWKKYTHMNVRKGLAPPPPKIPSEPVSVFGQQQVFFCPGILCLMLTQVRNVGNSEANRRARLSQTSPADLRSPRRVEKTCAISRCSISRPTSNTSHGAELAPSCTTHWRYLFTGDSKLHTSSHGSITLPFSLSIFTIWSMSSGRIKHVKHWNWS